MMTLEKAPGAEGSDDLARFLYNRRKQLRLTLRDMEERTGLSKTYLNNLERNLRANPTPESIEAIAEGYRVPWQVLYRLSTGQGKDDPLSRHPALSELTERMSRLDPSSLADILPLIEAMIGRKEEMDGKAKP